MGTEDDLDGQVESLLEASRQEKKEMFTNSPLPLKVRVASRRPSSFSYFFKLRTSPQKSSGTLPPIAVGGCYSQSDYQISASKQVLPPPPQVFFGRTSYVDRVVEQVTRDAQSRVAILGAGGMGKTSVALAAIHDSRVV